MLCFACYAMLGRPLDQHLWAGGSKWGVSGTVSNIRRMLRVGRPCKFLVFVCIELQPVQGRYWIAGGSS